MPCFASFFQKSQPTKEQNTVSMRPHLNTALRLHTAHPAQQSFLHYDTMRQIDIGQNSVIMGRTKSRNVMPIE